MAAKEMEKPSVKENLRQLGQEEMSEYFDSQLKKSFFQAVRKNDIETMENYLSRFQLGVDLTDELGNTALNLAAQLGLFDMVDRLI